MTATARRIPVLPSSTQQAPDPGLPAPGTVIPTWIDTPDGALAAHVHLPYGPECRGAAILVSPFGRTETTMRPAMRHLADLLARRGCVTIRADWSGTGESAAPLRDDGVVPPMARRLADVAALAHYARHTLGQGDLTLVGAGLGAALAAMALGDPQGPRADADGRTPYRSVVLVDPQPGDDAWVRLPAARAMSARNTGILLVSREEAPIDEAVEDYADRIGADRLDAIDLDALDVTATEPVIPVEAWDIVVDWLGLPARRPTPVPIPAQRVRTALGGGGTEEYVEVGGLPGVLTLPAATPRHAVLLVPDDGAHRGGPGGDGWVRLARAAARQGVATLRFDRSGAGEARVLGAVDGADAPVISPASVAEHVAAVEWLAARTGTRPTVVGHGAGAWTALAAAGRVSVTRVVSVAQDVWTTDPEQPGELGAWWFAHLPYPMILRLGRNRALPTPQPLIEAATARGAAIDLYGDARHAARFEAARGADALARLQARGASVHRYTERFPLDPRHPDLLDVMLGRVLGRVLRDLPADPTASLGEQVEPETTPVAYATIRGDASDAATAADSSGARDWTTSMPGGRRASAGYAPA
ncbi:MAG: hypothetical protein IPK37_12625 [Austwickia sp.]|nr:MAG: hypothetical protein IPK37_12625 [Austwickia sp.]